jgi:hypothetical protein
MKEAEFFDVKQRVALLEQQKKLEGEFQAPGPNESPQDIMIVTNDPPPRSQKLWDSDWTPFILGGSLGLAVIGYIYTQRANPQAKPAVTKRASQRETSLP